MGLGASEADNLALGAVAPLVVNHVVDPHGVHLARRKGNLHDGFNDKRRVKNPVSLVVGLVAGRVKHKDAVVELADAYALWGRGRGRGRGLEMCHKRHTPWAGSRSKCDSAKALGVCIR